MPDGRRPHKAREGRPPTGPGRGRPYGPPPPTSAAGCVGGLAGMRLRTIEPRDRAEVLALNAGSVQHLSPLDEERLATLLGWAYRAEILEVDGGIAAFVLVFAPGSPYGSPNYRWFAERYERFLYLDRIVVASPYRRR